MIDLNKIAERLSYSGVHGGKISIISTEIITAEEWKAVDPDAIVSLSDPGVWLKIVCEGECPKCGTTVSVEDTTRLRDDLVSTDTVYRHIVNGFFSYSRVGCYTCMNRSDIFLICPVRGLTPEQDDEIKKYIQRKEASGIKVHYPPRDTDQSDPIGLSICNTNATAIKNAKVIDIFWSTSSYGSCFDVGIAFSSRKPIRLIKAFEEDAEGKSFLKVIRATEEQTKHMIPLGV